MHPGNLVEVGKFYTIANDSYEEKWGFLKGQCVLVVGEGFWNISEEDPYLYRRYFAVAKFENGTLVLPSGEDDVNKPIIIAPEGLEEVSSDVQESLQSMLEGLKAIQ